jgi:hypothetical protein
VHKGLNDETSHVCRLSLAFSCGTMMTLHESLVIALASEHKAAPSEKQILQVLESSLTDENHQNQGVDVRVSSTPKKMVRHVVKGHDRVLVVQGLACQKRKGRCNNDLAVAAYSGACACGDDAHGESHCARGDAARPFGQNVAVMIMCGGDESSEDAAVLERALKSVLKKLDSDIVSHVVVAPEGSSPSPHAAISLVQHWAYHQRLAPALATVRNGMLEEEEEEHECAGPPPKFGARLVNAISVLGRRLVS